MTEYSEVIRQFKRMCKSISAAKCTRGECPMGREFGCENIGQCRKFAFERYAEFEKLVLAWAEEHPEPVYPTWAEWLHSQSLAHFDSSPAACQLSEKYCESSKDVPGCWVLTVFAKSPIPDDIAQKLGIEPREDVC